MSIFAQHNTPAVEAEATPSMTHDEMVMMEQESGGNSFVRDERNVVTNTAMDTTVDYNPNAHIENSGVLCGAGNGISMEESQYIANHTKKVLWAEGNEERKNAAELWDVCLSLKEKAPVNETNIDKVAIPSLNHGDMEIPKYFDKVTLSRVVEYVTTAGRTYSNKYDVDLAKELLVDLKATVECLEKRIPLMSKSNKAENEIEAYKYMVTDPAQELFDRQSSIESGMGNIKWGVAVMQEAEKEAEVARVEALEKELAEMKAAMAKLLKDKK